MSVVIFHLLTNPHAYKRLADELRSIERDEDITFGRLASMEYLTACIDEGMRMRPVVAAVIARVGPPGGGMVDGCFVPEGVSAYYPSSWASELINETRLPLVCHNGQHITWTPTSQTTAPIYLNGG